MSNFTIIDRRKNPKGKNLPNRKRFIERTKSKIKDKLKESLNKKSITSNDDEHISIDIEGVDEPSFGYDTDTGSWNYVLPGNKDYLPGDLLPKPTGGDGGESGNKPGSGDDEDSFHFTISRDEYLDIIFEGLELPDLVKRSQKTTITWQRKRSGTTKQGPSSNLDLPKSLRNSLGRRIALAFPLDRKIKELEEQIENTQDESIKKSLQIELEQLRIRRLSVAYFDPVDIRYRRYDKTPIPNIQAVMFCLMDVSGSMGEKQKEIAKRFFLLLYLFLQRKYTKIDVIFIRHTDKAKEVTEEEFFYTTESGGTEISTGIALMEEIVKDRYSPENWNLYCVQASDGDNMGYDNPKVIEIMNRILPIFQYYVYNEIYESKDANTYYHYSAFKASTTAEDLIELKSNHSNIEINLMSKVEDVVPTFRKVFAKK